MQESRSVLANMDCHALLELYITRCPYCQTPEHPVLARMSVTQSAAPPKHLALKGANPRTPGRPQGHTPVDKPHADLEVKPQLKLSSSVAKEEDPEPPYQVYKLQIKSTLAPRKTLCLWNI